MDEWNPDEPVRIPIEDVLDLHFFRPSEIREVVMDYLEEARAAGFRQVRLIHGKGKGVQRASIRSLLETIEWVSEFHDGGHGGGEWGATVVVLELDDHQG
jgi:DNA-nicking Smr family endonuclease